MAIVMGMGIGTLGIVMVAWIIVGFVVGIVVGHVVRQ
jgi:hypothetical protein